MSEAKPTTGPWAVRANGDGGDFLVHAEGYDTIIAEVVAEDVPGDESEANAWLISAAPCLLEACHATLDRLDYLQSLWSKEGITEGLAIGLRAAIAKAAPPDH